MLENRTRRRYCHLVPPRFTLRHGGNRAKRAPTDTFRCFPASIRLLPYAQIRPQKTIFFYGYAEAKTPYLSANTLHLAAKQPHFAPKSSVFTRFKPWSVLKPHSRWKMTQSRHYKLSGFVSRETTLSANAWGTMPINATHAKASPDKS